MKSAVVAVLLVLGLVGSGAAPSVGAGTTQVGTATAPSPKAAAKASTYVPPRGPVFNIPTGSRASRLAIITRVHHAIRQTPKGYTIRFATYNIDRRDTRDLLVAAKNRGVNVQIVVNDNLVGSIEKSLQAKLGKNPSRPSFLVICKNACRSGHPAGNLHMKTYSFSKTGVASGLIINSSANLGYGAMYGQWNDAFSVFGNTPLFQSWLKIFRQLRMDRPVAPRRVTYRSETLGVHYQRNKNGGRPATRETVRLASAGDAPVNRLRAINCKSPAGFGYSGRSVVRIAMYAWYGDRGERIAKQVAARKREGCDVKVIGSVVSAPVVSILKRSGIAVRAADWDFGEKLSTAGKDIVYGPRCYSHLKFITVNGVFNGRATKVVFTGSENWSAPSLSNDEVTYEIHDAAVLQTYNTRWRQMWDDKNTTHPTGIEPTRRPCP